MKPRHQHWICTNNKSIEKWEAVQSNIVRHMIKPSGENDLVTEMNRNLKPQWLLYKGMEEAWYFCASMLYTLRLARLLLWCHLGNWIEIRILRCARVFVYSAAGSDTSVDVDTSKSSSLSSPVRVMARRMFKCTSPRLHNKTIRTRVSIWQVEMVI